MAIGIETVRMAYLSGSYRSDHPEEYGAIQSLEQLSTASIAKVYAADVSVTVTNRAMEQMVATGMSETATWENIGGTARLSSYGRVGLSWVSSMSAAPTMIYLCKQT
jgi:alkylation response protein AidB-like acyl-CoA dehydrogenase